MARLQHVSQVDISRTVWSIDGVLSGLSLLWAGPGVGKTFVAISMSVSIATGRPWIGRRTHQGPVYYIVGEGGTHNIANRMRAALHEWAVEDPIETVPLFLVSPGMNFVDVESAADFAHLIGSPEILHRFSPQLIVVDTLSRNFVGDENKQEEMGKFVKSLDLLREAYGCDILVIHHANKEEELRGSSVLFGAVDCSWKLTRTHVKVENEKPMLLRADKLKDRDSAHAFINMRALKEVIRDEDGNATYDEFGDEETTLIIKPNKDDIERAKNIREKGLTLLGQSGTITYDEWFRVSGMTKPQFNGALTFILTYPGRWGIMRGIKVGTFVKAQRGVENVW